MKNKINTRQLTNKVFEDGIKKTVELAIIGIILGLTLNTLFLTVAGAIGGSLYFEDNQNTNLGGKIKWNK
jgi:hypothetical protein